MSNERSGPNITDPEVHERIRKLKISTEKNLFLENPNCVFPLVNKINSFALEDETNK